LVDQLVENQAENYNAERALKGRERRQTEADAEEELIGMLPEEIQPFFQALNTAEDAYLEMQEIQANKVLAENKKQELDASYATTPDYIKEYLTFDEYSGYGIDLAKINQIED
jgi:lipase chaperone LimK